MLGEEQIYLLADLINKYKLRKYWWANKFIDTIKYYQQSLAVLDAAMTETEQQNIKKQCRKFIANHQKLNQRFLSCTQEAQ